MKTRLLFVLVMANLLSAICLMAAGKVVFTSDRDGDKEIYKINDDGTGLVQLTSNSSIDKRPSFSPDGSKIAFSSNRSGDYEVYIMDSDGSNQTRLITSASTSSVNGVDWLDADTIIFSGKSSGIYRLYTVDSDGTNQTLYASSSKDLQGPRVSLDGNTIYYYKNTPYNGYSSEVYALSLGGTATQLTFGATGDSSGDYSKFGVDILVNGVKKLILGTRDGGYWQLFLADLDGSNPQNISTGSSYHEHSPVTNSLNDSEFVFTSKKSGEANIWKMKVDGSGLTQITQSGGAEPDWFVSSSSCDTTTSYNSGYEAGKAYCIANPSACGIDTSTPDSDTAPSPGITSSLIEGLEEGWHLMGTSQSLSDYSVFDSADKIWTYSMDGSWKSYDPQSSSLSAPSIGIDDFDGFWLKKTSSSTTNRCTGKYDLCGTWKGTYTPSYSCEYELTIEINIEEDHENQHARESYISGYLTTMKTASSSRNCEELDKVSFTGYAMTSFVEFDSNLLPRGYISDSGLNVGDASEWSEWWAKRQ